MLRERHDASHGTGGWGDFHLTLDTWFISQNTRLITHLGRGVGWPVLRRSEKCRRPHHVGAEPARDPVHGLLRFPPSGSPVIERDLPRRPGDRAKARRPDA